MNHLDDATVASFVDNRLSQAENNRVYEHLAECPACTEWVANVIKTPRDGYNWTLLIAAAWMVAIGYLVLS